MERLIVFSIIAFVASAVCGLIFIPQILYFCKRNRLYDLPNERKVHHNAVPRLGGVAFVPSMLLAFMMVLMMISFQTDHRISFSLWSVYFFIGLAMVYIVGFIDDLVGVAPVTKFIVQICAACVMPLSGLSFNNLYGLFGIYEIPLYLGWAVTVFVVVFIVNAMNLIDGIDGLSGGLSLLALSGFLYSFALQGLWYYVIFITGLMGVLVAFLYFNIFGNPKKNQKIFMGDAGSLSLGFILAFLCVKFAMDNQAVMPYRRDGLLLSYTLLIVPAFDVIRVSLYRLRHHCPLFLADKNHIHHKLMRAGLSQRQTLIVILTLSMSFFLINRMLASIFEITWIVLVDIAIWVLFHFALNYRISRVVDGRHALDTKVAA
jgi:UDP-GlcNAc:undecaprenyl-phosphate GlcNAc-1-phosphate transferase